ERAAFMEQVAEQLLAIVATDDVVRDEVIDVLKEHPPEMTEGSLAFLPTGPRQLPVSGPPPRELPRAPTGQPAQEIFDAARHVAVADPGRARAMLAHLVETDPGHPDVVLWQLELGAATQRLGDSESAALAYAAALRAGPSPGLAPRLVQRGLSTILAIEPA